MPRVFVPRFRFWLLEVVLPCLVVGAIIVGPYVTEGKFAWVPTAFLAILCFSLVLVPALRTRVVTTPECISGYVGFRTFRLDWLAIVVADFRQSDPLCPCLVLATTREIVQIPLAALDVEGIREVVWSRVRRFALEKEAYQQSPEYQKLAEQNVGWVEVAKPRRIREVHPLIAALIIAGAATFSLATIELWSSSPWLRWFTMGVAVTTLVPIIPSMGVIEVDPLAISRVNPLGVLRIPWDEVERLAITPDGNGLDLYGETHGKKTTRALLGPGWWWPSEQRRAVLAMLELICRHRGIDFQPFVQT